MLYNSNVAHTKDTMQRSTSSWLNTLIFIAFNLLFFLTPFVFTWMNQELFEFSKMIYVYLLSIIIMTLWIIKMIANRQLIFQRSPFDLVLWVFLLSQVMATIFSIHQRTSWFGYYTRFNGGLWSTITFIALFHAAVSNLNRQQVKMLLSSLLLSTLLISWWAIPEKFGHSMSCWLITQQFDVNCWTANNNPQDRVFASFGQPNWLAAFLITLLPLTLHYLLTKRQLWQKLYFGLILLSGTTALWLTKSRSGLLGFGIGLGFYGLVTFLAKKNRQWRIFVLTACALLLGLGAIAWKWWWQPTAAERALQQDATFVSEGGTPSEDIRKIVWQGAWQVWQRYPIFGAGVETFAYSYYLDRPAAHNLVSEWDFLYNKAHNELLNLLANTGLFGLLSYLAIFVALLHYLSRQPLNSKHLSLTAGLIGMFVSNFFGFSTVMTNLLLFGFLSMIVITTTPHQKLKSISSKKVEIKRKNTNKEYVLYTITGVLSVVLLQKTWRIWQADYLFTSGESEFKRGNYQQGLGLMQTALRLSPNEAFFYDELASDYAQISLALHQEQQATASAEFARAAIESNQQALLLNPRHLNFYKNQARIYITLGQLNIKFYEQAAQALEQAILLAPTDAKLYYNLGLVLEIIGKTEEAKTKMEQAVALKSNYLQARNELARMYFIAKDYQAAIDQYRYSLEKIAPHDSLVQEKLRVVEASLSATSSTTTPLEK